VRAQQRRSQPERRAATRAKLIRAAIGIIARRGYASLTTPEIAAAAGVSRGALQHHFATRHDLVAAVSEQLTARMLALDEALVSGEKPLAARIAAVVGHYWTVYTSDAYLAILDIALGRQRRLGRDLTDVSRKSDAPWFKLFADCGKSRRELAALRRLTLASLRGLAVARFLGIQRGPAAAELALLKAVLQDRLGPPERHRGR